MASFYPLAFLAERVGGDHVQVSTLVPPGAEPHDWEPSARDLRSLAAARVFLYNGAGFEGWLEKVRSSVETRHLIEVDASQGVKLVAAPGGETDPHLWLDPVINQDVVRRIAAALKAADPAHQADYEQNAGRLIGGLADLDVAYREGLATCQRRDIIVSHAFFAYPAQRYNLKQIPIMEGVGPDVEPTPAQLAELARFAREHSVQYIFFETLVSPKVAQVLASEVGARTLALDPIEGLTPADTRAGKDYLTQMQANLANLRLALGCQ